MYSFSSWLRIPDIFFKNDLIDQNYVSFVETTKIVPLDNP